MERLSTAEQARRFVMEKRLAGQTVGLVPTMGALHDGHLSLIRAAQRQCDQTVATIFVNPTQFGPNEDLSRYPRPIEQDLDLLSHEKTAAVFLPDNQTMYPEGFSTYVQPPQVANQLEGLCRPGHFQGVATVVLKLFQILPATHAFFGRKDYQQLKVIEAMVRDLNVGIEIVPCETMRDPDGLAMSSRNRYLSDSQRTQALQLPAALNEAEKQVACGGTQIEALEATMQQTLQGLAPATATAKPNAGVDRIEYASIVDAETLLPISRLDRPAVALIAAFVGQTRLIDNRVLTPPSTHVLR